jgi:hypothetical protein
LIVVKRAEEGDDELDNHTRRKKISATNTGTASKTDFALAG